MLIDFTVENYRSIKEPMTLSAVAQAGRTAAPAKRSVGREYIQADSEIAPTFPIPGRGFELLPVLGIFGANASGKSNVLSALDNLMGFMFSEAGDNHYSLSRFVPFRLDDHKSYAPTCFQMRAVVNKVIYTYTLHVKRSRILLERLEALPASPKRVRLLFERQWSDEQQQFLWKNGEEFAGPHTQIESQIQDTEPFIGILSRRLKVPSIEPLTVWLRAKWPGVSLGFEASDQDITSWINHQSEENLNAVTALVRRFDTGIEDIRIVKNDDELQQSLLGEYEVFVKHKTSTNSVWWSLKEESTGTQRLFCLAGKMLSSFEWGTPMLVDELGANIHPHIAREIVRLFQSQQTNPKRAQLLFTSHDNTLQQRNLLRRDQLWFTEKHPDGSTELYPLTDFKPRNDLAIDKAYLDGRFGAVPILPDTEDFLKTVQAVEDPERELVA